MHFIRLYHVFYYLPLFLEKPPFPNFFQVEGKNIKKGKTKFLILLSLGTMNKAAERLIHGITSISTSPAIVLHSFLILTLHQLPLSPTAQLLQSKQFFSQINTAYHYSSRWNRYYVKYSIVQNIYRITESLRLEKTSKITKSSCQPNATVPAKPCPEVPCLHIFNTPRDGDSTTSLGSLFQSNSILYLIFPKLALSNEQCCIHICNSKENTVSEEM